MYIVIVGAGEVGSYLARILSEEQHDVAIIESDERLAREMDSALDALVVHGSGVSKESLEQAGIRRAKVFIAVTQVDEVNLIACMTAAKYGTQLMTVARVREAQYLTGVGHLSAQELGLSLLVGPERAVADKVVELLGYEGAGEIRYLCDQRIVLLELPLSDDSPLVHETLAEVADALPQPGLVAGVLGSQGFRIPRGDSHLRADERAEVLTTPDNIDEYLILSGKPWHHVRHVLIVGCGTIGYQLAKRLESQRLYPTIVENDLERANWVAKHLTKSIVLHGDGTDPEFLREQLDEYADAVVVLMDDDEKAVLVGLFAKQLGAKKVLVRADKLAYATIAHKMGIDALISPRREVANAILRFVRRGRVATTQMLGDHEGELIDIRVPSEPKNKLIIEKPLKELDLPADSLVGVVIRGGNVFIADGDTILAPGDELLVVALPQAIQKVERLLR